MQLLVLVQVPVLLEVQTLLLLVLFLLLLVLLLQLSVLLLLEAPPCWGPNAPQTIPLQQAEQQAHHSAHSHLPRCAYGPLSQAGPS